MRTYPKTQISMTLTHIFQHLQEQQLDAIVRKERPPLVTTARHEVKVIHSVTSLKTGGHERNRTRSLPNLVVTCGTSCGVWAPTLSPKEGERMGNPLFTVTKL
jgi:hypothetical protein